MDTVLGVSMTPPAIHAILVEGDDGSGVVIDHSDDAGSGLDDPVDRVAALIAAARNSAREGGYRLASTGVAVADQAQADALREALNRRGIDEVTLVSPLLSAAALTQTVGASMGYARTALLYLEAGSATLAVVDSANGSIGELHRVALPADPEGSEDEASATRSVALARQAGDLVSRPAGMFVVGNGVDVAALRPELAAASSIPVSVPAEPHAALAQGAALASAHAPLFDSSTTALAWSRDPGTGAINPDLAAYLSGAGQSAAAADDYDATAEAGALAYSAVADDPGTREETWDGTWNDQAGDAAPGTASPELDESGSRRPFLLVGSAMTAFLTASIATLVTALVVSVSPTAAYQPIRPESASPEALSDVAARPAPPVPSSEPLFAEPPVVRPPPADVAPDRLPWGAVPDIPDSPVFVPERIPEAAIPDGGAIPGLLPAPAPGAPVVVPVPIPIPLPPLAPLAPMAPTAPMAPLPTNDPPRPEWPDQRIPADGERPDDPDDAERPARGASPSPTERPTEPRTPRQTSPTRPSPTQTSPTRPSPTQAPPTQASPTQEPPTQASPTKSEPSPEKESPSRTESTAKPEPSTAPGTAVEPRPSTAPEPSAKPGPGRVSKPSAATPAPSARRASPTARPTVSAPPSTASSARSR